LQSDAPIYAACGKIARKIWACLSRMEKSEIQRHVIQVDNIAQLIYTLPKGAYMSGCASNGMRERAAGSRKGCPHGRAGMGCAGLWRQAPKRRKKEGF
jgi:hypothetical protein